MKAIYYSFEGMSGDTHDGVIALFTTQEKAEAFLALLEQQEKEYRAKPSKCPLGWKNPPMYFRIEDDYQAPPVDPTELKGVWSD